MIVQHVLVTTHPLVNFLFNILKRPQKSAVQPYPWKQLIGSRDYALPYMLFAGSLIFSRRSRAYHHTIVDLRRLGRGDLRPSQECARTQPVHMHTRVHCAWLCTCSQLDKSRSRKSPKTTTVYSQVYVRNNIMDTEMVKSVLSSVNLHNERCQ